MQVCFKKVLSSGTLYQYIHVPADCLQPYKDILQNDCKGTCRAEFNFHTLTLFNVNILIILDITQVMLLSSIGQGSFSTVYRATWRGSLVAAKVIQMGEESRHVIGEVERYR